jgi:hypothetical protein
MADFESDPIVNANPAPAAANTAADGNSKLEALLEEIKNAVAEFKTLEIVTVVGTVIPGESVKDLSFKFDKNSKTILTRIDILDGDITTVIDEAYVTGDYQSLREFHAQREEKGYSIVRNNIAAIRELFSAASALLKE